MPSRDPTAITNLVAREGVHLEPRVHLAPLRAAAAVVLSAALLLFGHLAMRLIQLARVDHIELGDGKTRDEEAAAMIGSETVVYMMRCVLCFGQTVTNFCNRGRHVFICLYNMLFVVILLVTRPLCYIIFFR